MNKKTFDPIKFYSSYPNKVIGRPGYPARAAFKSALLFSLYGRRVFSEIDKITTYADIGGCFGFGANAMGFYVAKRQGTLPRIMVFETASDFVNVGKVIFPHIEFVKADFVQWCNDVKVFDLVTLFDVVEHIVDPEPFLQYVAAHSRFVMLKTPMETSGEWRGTKPPTKIGENHPDGHINFFSPIMYEKLLNTSNFDIVEHRLVPTIVPTGARMALIPESDAKPTGLNTLRRSKNLIGMALRLLPFQLVRKVLGGGDHICLCRSRLFN